MSDAAKSSVPPRWLPWAQLVRLPNVFTVVADVAAAYLLVARGPEPIAALVIVVLAAVCLYWAGMVLNDVFDIERDRIERPKRPLPSGQITLGQASSAGWILLTMGVLLGGVVGFAFGDGSGRPWLPLLVAVALAAMVVAYDGPLKRTPLAPVAMGGCRVLSFLLGAAAAISLQPEPAWFPREVIGIACAFGVYIMGITTMARREATGGRSANLIVGWLVSLVGIVMLAFAPQLAEPPTGFHVRDDAFAMLVLLVASPSLLRGIRAIMNPTPKKIQMAIRVGIMTIIPLAACFAFLGAGPFWGLMIFILMPPTISLSLRFRVT